MASLRHLPGTLIAPFWRWVYGPLVWARKPDEDLREMGHHWGAYGCPHCGASFEWCEPPWWKTDNSGTSSSIPIPKPRPRPGDRRVMEDNSEAHYHEMVLMMQGTETDLRTRLQQAEAERDRYKTAVEAAIYAPLLDIDITENNENASEAVERWQRFSDGALAEAHSGDCTKEAHPCRRCHVEMVVESTDVMLAALQRREGGEES